MSTVTQPKHRKQKRKKASLEFVEIDGQRTYLGKYKTAASNRQRRRW